MLKGSSCNETTNNFSQFEANDLDERESSGEALDLGLSWSGNYPDKLVRRLYVYNLA